ncbi:hypothetical protein StoSoilB5_24560 [Arthrobacter sp. StoSoilB5]|nr:hypothetical protein StoSoilB5_24560 [Arthrobacter sp. StoSoilB5]
MATTSAGFRSTKTRPTSAVISVMPDPNSRRSPDKDDSNASDKLPAFTSRAAETTVRPSTTTARQLVPCSRSPTLIVQFLSGVYQR